MENPHDTLSYMLKSKPNDLFFKQLSLKPIDSWHPTEKRHLYTSYKKELVRNRRHFLAKEAQNKFQFSLRGLCD